MSASATFNRAAACWAGVGGGGAPVGGCAAPGGVRPPRPRTGLGGVVCAGTDAGAATDVRMFHGQRQLAVDADRGDAGQRQHRERAPGTASRAA